MFVNIFKQLLCWNSWINFNQISYASFWQFEDHKFVQMIMVTWLTWPPCPSMVKTFKHLFLQNHWADYIETWYVASVDWVLPNFSYGDPMLTMTHFCQCQIWSLCLLNGEKVIHVHCIFLKQGYFVIWKWILHKPLWMPKVKVISLTLASGY